MKIATRGEFWGLLLGLVVVGLTLTSTLSGSPTLDIVTVFAWGAVVLIGFVILLRAGARPRG